MDMQNQSQYAPKSTLDTLKERSLESAGYAYLVADAALMAAALIRKEPQIGVAIGSAVWGLGSLAAVGFGHKSAERHLYDLSKTLRDDLDKRGIAIPSTSRLSAESLAQKEGVIDNIQNFLYRNPSQTLNAIYGLGGVVNAVSAKPRDTGYKLSGGLVATGGLLGILLAEKDKPKDTAESASGSMNPVKWFTDKPLRISGAAYMANNLFLVKSAMEEVERVPKIGKFAAAASYMLANIMFAISSKDHSKQSAVPQEVLAQIEQEAATVIASLPPSAQAGLLEHVAQHLSTQEGINDSKEDIQNAMQTRIAELSAPESRIAHAQTHGANTSQANSVT